MLCNQIVYLYSRVDFTRVVMLNKSYVVNMKPKFLLLDFLINTSGLIVKVSSINAFSAFFTEKNVFIIFHPNVIT